MNPKSTAWIEKEAELADAEQAYLEQLLEIYADHYGGKEQIPAGKSQIADGKKRLDEELAPA
ncbi:MAG: hypothetical protein ACLR2O_15945 [Coprococcus sp.]